MVHSNELKFDIYIEGHSPTYPIDLGEFRIKFFNGSKKKKEFLYIIDSAVKLYEIC